MLNSLSVNNYALIDRLTVDFTAGFNVLTGETGAGKSILIGALGLLLGSKADSSMIRSGAEETLVSCVITLNNNEEINKWLGEHGISPDDNTLIVRRTVKKNGRSTIFIQSVPVTRAELNELASFLFDIHGQHEHQSLLNLDNHRKLLDRYGGTEILAKRFHELFKKLSEMKESFNKLVNDEKQRNREIDILKYSITEIKNVDLHTGEEEELEDEFKILSNYEKLFELLENAYSNTAESRGGALSYMRNARNALDQVVRINPKMASLVQELENSFYAVEEISDELRKYQNSIEFDPERMAVVEERLSVIRMLESKYGNSIDEILEYLSKCEEDLERLSNWENERHKLEVEIKKYEKEVRAQAQVLSEKRRTAGKALETKIESELKNLGMEKARFRVHIEEKKGDSGKPVIGSLGKDYIEFVIAPNQGEPYKKLRSIASGGELSRVMLAIKSVLSSSDSIDTLIFDEIDVGIGGQVAIAVGGKLTNLSKSKQVICITHLATIAVQADNHIIVKKHEEQGRTLTSVECVKDEKRVTEIARMLSGDSNTNASLNHARELLLKYSKV
ncbi:MAG: DNA repair protein RecN [Spirochaetales bacterium]|nr:DNA repair protein RecN [Spirochaetales bacterium]